MSMICGLCCASQQEIDSLLAHPDTIIDFLEGSRLSMDLDKAWHGIHFLLNGAPWEGREPLCYLLAGGQEIGDVDVGYGPARAISPTQVAEFSKALSAITSDEFRRRYDPEAMTKAEIYPDIWDRSPPEDDPLGYLLEYYSQLKDFVTTAHQNGWGLVLSMG